MISCSRIGQAGYIVTSCLVCIICGTPKHTRCTYPRSPVVNELTIKQTERQRPVMMTFMDGGRKVAELDHVGYRSFRRSVFFEKVQGVLPTLTKKYKLQGWLSSPLAHVGRNHA